MLGSTTTASYGVIGTTYTPLLGSTTYTLSVDVGYAAGTAISGDATYKFVLGYWDGNTASSFTALQSQQGTVTHTGNITGTSANSTTYSLSYTTASTAANGDLAVQLYQVGTNPMSGGADYMSFDNVILTASAVPEPAADAAIFGAIALVGTFLWRMRIMAAPVA